MLRQFFSKAALLCFLAAAPTGFVTQVVYAQTQPNTAALPVDPKVTIGQLPNGLKYYIRPNSKPENKVELRLIVNAGSILETDEQQGLAHFMEHMNFNGTKNYPKNKLVDFLQSIGVEFGADLNAYTSFDETVYILPIPTDKPGNLESGFQVLEDWAQHANLTDEDIDSERGVVLEESRGRKGAQDRMMQKYLPKVLYGSQYAHRLPIGKDEVLKNFKYETLRSFYRDWYRPDLMAVAVVGDITVDKAEALIKKHFAHLKNPANPKPREAFQVKPYTDASTMVITDKEATNFMFQLMFSARPKKESVTVNDYRNDMIKSLFFQIINKRLNELTQSATPPFAAAYVYAGGYARGYENFSVMAIPTNDVEGAINAAIGELVKAQEFGLNNSELEIAKKSMLSQMEKTYNERNTTESGRIIGEYVRNFLTGEAMPGIEQEYKYYQELLPGITLQEVNAEINKWLAKEDNQEYFAMITGPADSRQVKLPTDMELKNIINKSFSQKVQANEERVVAENLLEKDPVPGKITSEQKDADLAATTYTLSNGVKVSVKKTDFKSDEIILTAVKKGGTGNYGAEDRSNVAFLDNVIEAMGYGQFTPTQLTDALSGKTVGLLPSMNETSNKIRGNSSVKDFESLLQLVHLQLTQPRMDQALFEGFRNTMKMQLQFLGSNPQVAFIDTLGKFMYNNNPRRPIMVPTVADIEQLNAERIVEIYKNEFSNADGFHFFIVGNVDENAIKPLLEKYIASLPAKGTSPAFKDNGVRTVEGKHVFKFHKGQEQQSLIVPSYHGEAAYSEELALHADMIAEVLTIRVLEEVREEMGAMYSGGFMSSFERDPYPHYSITGQFPCGPENVDAIVKKVEEEIADIRANGPRQKDLDKVKMAKLEKRRENIKTNNYWGGKLESLLFWNFDKKRFMEMDAKINAVTVADLKASANKLFNTGNTLTAILYPEAAAGTAAPERLNKKAGIAK